jgi:hypothetical protein
VDWFVVLGVWCEITKWQSFFGTPSYKKGPANRWYLADETMGKWVRIRAESVKPSF